MAAVSLAFTAAIRGGVEAADVVTASSNAATGSIRWPEPRRPRRLTNVASPRRNFLKGSSSRPFLGPGALLRALRSEEHTSELQSQSNLVCRLLLEKKNNEI